MYRLEVNLVVEDCKEAVLFYETVFNAEKNYLSDLPKGSNEAGLLIGGVDIHLFDQNSELFAPRQGENAYMWWHIIVDDVDAVCKKARNLDCLAIQEPKDIEEYGVRQCVIVDPFGYSWILTQVYPKKEESRAEEKPKAVKTNLDQREKKSKKTPSGKEKKEKSVHEDPNLIKKDS